MTFWPFKTLTYPHLRFAFPKIWTFFPGWWGWRVSAHPHYPPPQPTALAVTCCRTRCCNNKNVITSRPKMTSLWMWYSTVKQCSKTEWFQKIQRHIPSSGRITVYDVGTSCPKLIIIYCQDYDTQFHEVFLKIHFTKLTLEILCRQKMHLWTIDSINVIYQTCLSPETFQTSCRKSRSRAPEKKLGALNAKCLAKAWCYCEPALATLIVSKAIICGQL